MAEPVGRAGTRSGARAMLAACAFVGAPDFAWAFEPSLLSPAPIESTPLPSLPAAPPQNAPAPISKAPVAKKPAAPSQAVPRSATRAPAAAKAAASPTPANPSRKADASAPRKAPRAEPSLSGVDLMERANVAPWRENLARARDVDPAVLRLQVMLARTHASPGAVDGVWGSNLGKAIAAARIMRGLPAEGGVDAALWSALESFDAAPVLTRYTLLVEDVAGPFTPDIPKDYGEMARLPRLGYRTSLERLGEKFHMDEALLRRLNPGVSFDAVGASIIVVDVGKRARGKVVRVVADKAGRQLRGYDAAGALLVAYPATIGSKTLPSPSGVHKVRAVAVNPDYWYRPAVNFKQGDNDKPLRIPPGPNNPVGSVWIGLDKPTYGIHGTPEPTRIDKTNSHGCIRLTNWDAEELVKLIQIGAPVEFLETAPPASAPPAIAPFPIEPAPTEPPPAIAQQSAPDAPAKGDGVIGDGVMGNGDKIDARRVDTTPTGAIRAKPRAVARQ